MRVVRTARVVQNAGIKSISTPMVPASRAALEGKAVFSSFRISLPDQKRRVRTCRCVML